VAGQVSSLFISSTLAGSFQITQISPKETDVQGLVLQRTTISPAGNSRRTALRKILVSAAAKVVDVHLVPVKLQLLPESAIAVEDQPPFSFNAALY
jgi:hypothetical protein